MAKIPTTITVPIRRRGRELKLSEVLATSDFGPTKIEFSRTYDGDLRIKINGRCYVVTFEDIILQAIDVDEEAEASATACSQCEHDPHPVGEQCIKMIPGSAKFEPGDCCCLGDGEPYLNDHLA